MEIYYNPKLKQLSKNLRRDSTLAEVLIGNELKSKKIMGFQFMRQKPIGDFIVDFFCYKLKLVIEIDGESHGFHSQQKRDNEKDNYLNSLGINVIRYDDTEVKTDTCGVIDHLIDWIEYHQSSVKD